jgi:hypothetical protein
VFHSLDLDSLKNSIPSADKIHKLIVSKIVCLNVINIWITHFKENHSQWPNIWLWLGAVQS